MKKEISREDERKLYDAYEVLDRLCNGISTVDIIVNERWAKFIQKLIICLKMLLQMHIIAENIMNIVK